MLYRGALVPRRELSAGPAPRKTVQLIQKFRGDRKSVQSKTAEDPSRASFGDRDDLTAYLEEDGVLLSIALLIAVALLAITGVAVWKMVAGAVWIGRSWL